MKTYKVTREKVDGDRKTFFYDEDEGTARRIYKKMKNEKVIKTRWAELIESDWDDPDGDDEVLQGFERKIEIILGQKILMPYYEEYGKEKSNDTI